MKIIIKQVRGGSGVDVWAENLCRGINSQCHTCNLDLQPSLYQFIPVFAKLHNTADTNDVIQSNSWNGYAFKGITPLVITEHLVINDPGYNPYRTIPQSVYHHWIYRCERKTLDVADSVACVSQFAQKKLEEVFGYTGSQVIYNGIDTSVFRPTDENCNVWNIPHNKTVLFFAGNLSRRKGADLLPSIVKQLGEQFVLLIATGQRETSFGNMNNIINLGHLDLPHLVMAYNQCDIFLSATRLEGFGLSVAEAMACEKPVVATNGSSMPELVVNEKGGFLCEIDNVRDFAEKIRYLAENEQERRRMGALNRQRVIENFEINKMVEQYIALYRSL